MSFREVKQHQTVSQRHREITVVTGNCADLSCSRGFVFKNFDTSVKIVTKYCVVVSIQGLYKDSSLSLNYK